MATMAMIASETSGVPWSFTAHRGDIAANNLLFTKASRAAFVRFISESGRRMAASLAAAPPPGKSAIIHMGVKTPDGPPVVPFPRQTPLIVCPAYLYPVKGHCHLLRAMAILKQRGVAGRLDVVGEGELLDSLRALSDELKLGETVRFLGHRLNEEILRWYAEGAVDIVVLPSLDLGNNLHEGIPVSLMEAMTHGVAVVSTTTGGIPELLHDGAGEMVPPQDPVALADALQRLLVDPARRRRLAEAGRRRVEEEFALSTVVRQLSARMRETGSEVAARR
jgi:glycosyltransferase involved in cell wall biosynthesis